MKIIEKKSWIATVLVLLPISVFASFNDTTKQKSSLKRFFSAPGYGGVALKIQCSNSTAYLNYGFFGAINVTRRFSIGSAGFFPTSSVMINHDDPELNSQPLRFWYGGIMPEFRFGMDKRMGWFMNAILGSGEYKLNDNEGKFWVVEPQAVMSYKLTKKIRVELGISYRQTFDLDLKELRTEDFNSFTGFFQFRIGEFY